MKKKILSVALAGVMALTSVPIIGISNVQASVPNGSVQHVDSNDMYNTVFTVVVTDLDGNVIESLTRAPVVVVGLVGAVKWLFGSTVFSNVGLVFSIFKNGVITNTLTFVKGATAANGVHYSVEIGSRVYRFIVQ